MNYNKNTISWYILIIGILFAITFYLFKFQFELINSSAFSSFATLLVGGVAIYLYLKQKKDHKIQAARILLLEIRTAEEQIEQTKEKIKRKNDGDLFEDLPLIFPSKSWKKYSNLFVQDFDSDELRLISLFYDHCEIIENFALRNNEFFWVTTEERAKIVQQKMAEIITAKIVGRERGEETSLNNIKQELLDDISNDAYLYIPKKAISEIESNLVKITKITTSSAGVKLKNIAKMI